MDNHDSDGNCYVLFPSTYKLQLSRTHLSSLPSSSSPPSDSERASFPNRKRGQGLSSEPAFAGSSDGTRGRDDEMEASSAPALLLGVPDDQRELSFSRIALAADVFDMVSKCCCCESRVALFRAMLDLQSHGGRCRRWWSSGSSPATSSRSERAAPRNRKMRGMNRVATSRR